jgi:hypothetical protein
MKHNYNFRVDPPLPSEEQIAKHKDFDAVLKRYEQVVPQLHRKPLYKNPKSFLSLTLAGVIGFLVFQAVREEEKATEPTQPVVTAQATPPAEILEAEANAFLTAPIPDAAPVLHQLAVRADAPAMMRLADGSTIEVPKDAFETMDGRPVQGDIQVAVRVLRDPLDHVLAGLPLKDAEGRSFLTGASVEVSAGQGKHPLRLRPGTQLRIQLQVPKGAPSSALMHLDTEKRHWTAVPGARLETVAQQGGAPTREPADGFGVVEFGPDGKPIHKQVSKQGAEPKVQQFVQVVEVAELGRYSLRSGTASTEDQSRAVRVADASGQPQQVFALHRVVRGGQDAKALASFFPQSAQFDYTLHWNSAQAAVFFGFLPDGRVAYGSSAELRDHQPKAPWVLQVSPAPIKNKSDLVQLLGI